MAAMGLLLSCSEITLEAAIQAANEECPSRIDDVTVITKIQRHGDYVEYIAALEEGVGEDVNNLNEPEARVEMKKLMLASLKDDSDNDTKVFIELLKTNKVGIEVRYIGSRTQNEVMIRIEHWDL